MHKTALTQSILDRCVQDAAAGHGIRGFLLHVCKGGLSLTAAAGNLDVSSRFFAASVTKLFVTAVILRFESEGRLGLRDGIARYLPPGAVDGLHVMDGIDRSRSIEVLHLLSNTSGIPDYLDQEALDLLLAGNDKAWDKESVLKAARRRQPAFPPGRRAEYSDTNFVLLGAIIETVAGRAVDEIFDGMIINPLGLEDTYLYKGEPDSRLAPMHHMGRAIQLPLYMASLGARGGIVTTAADLGRFLKAFFGGILFDASRIQDLAGWRLLPGPGMLRYGPGILKQPLSIPDSGKVLYGHWGRTGAFAFHEPESATCLSGTVNEFQGHTRALRAMISVLRHPVC